MELVERLEAGTEGVRCHLPPHDVVEQRANSALLRLKGEDAVLLRAIRLPWRLDLRPEHRTALQADVQWAARQHFEDMFEPRIHPVTNTPVEPRTRDQSWTPLIELEEKQLGAPVLWILHRLQYVPTLEHVQGTWLLPLANGLLSLSVMAIDQTTGYREAMLMLQNDHQKGLGQAFMDAPEHDALFPTHCLSRVRSARRWFEDEGRGCLRVDSAGPPRDAGELELTEADCAVTPPPRFVRLPPGTLPMSPSLAMFTRVSLGDGYTPRMLNVWRHTHRIQGDARSALTKLARQTAAEWEREGARDVQVSVRAATGANGPEAHAHVRFHVDAPRQEVQIWFADSDGSVFRIGVDGHGSYSEDTLWQEAHSVRASFRRLPKKRRWWPFG